MKIYYNPKFGRPKFSEELRNEIINFRRKYPNISGNQTSKYFPISKSTIHEIWQKARKEGNLK